MRSISFSLFAIALCLLVLLPVMAQETDEPRAEISWPPPVYVLRGEVSLRGTVNLPGMSSYYIEVRALDDDLGAPEGRPWLPATLPTAAPVVDGVLGIWDTSTLADGLYELRLNVLAPDGDMAQRVVGPLRLENEAMMADDMTMTMIGEEAMMVSGETAMVTARVNANVRSGDSTRFRAIDVLLNGESASILGISTRGSGWYQIALPDDRRGWISPIVVQVSGATDDLPGVTPPALPPLPVAVAPTVVPFSDIDLVAGFLRHGSPGGVIKCGIGFQVEVDIANFGTTRSPGGRVRFLDYGLKSDGGRIDNIAQEEVAIFPPIDPGQTVGAKAWMTISRHVNQNHVIYADIDFDNAIPERTTDNNRGQMGLYKLAKGNC